MRHPMSLQLDEMARTIGSVVEAEQLDSVNYQAVFSPPVLSITIVANVIGRDGPVSHPCARCSKYPGAKKFFFVKIPFRESEIKAFIRNDLRGQTTVEWHPVKEHNESIPCPSEVPEGSSNSVLRFRMPLMASQATTRPGLEGGTRIQQKSTVPKGA